MQGAIDATNAIDLGETSRQTAGPEFKAHLSAARPELSGAAVDALASRWFFERAWIGRASDPAPRFFALFAAREGQAVPRALFRRRVEAGHTIDEVLHDVDSWRPDTRGRVQHAIKRYLNSDLDEISPAQAAEFERMVADRSYRPFTAPWVRFSGSSTGDRDGDDRLGASVMAQAPPIAPGVLRPGGVYARTGDEWYLSTQSWARHTKLPWVELRTPGEGETFRIPVGAVQATTRVTPEVEYEGFWFRLGSLWTSDRTRIWDPTPLTAPDCFAVLLYVGDHRSAVLELPGAEDLDDRSSMGGATLTVRVSDVSDYRETLETVTVEEKPE
ncbi:hypothetical protein [Microbacterium sp. P5_E9]